MKGIHHIENFVVFVMALLTLAISYGALRGNSGDHDEGSRPLAGDRGASAAIDPMTEELMRAKQALRESDAYERAPQASEWKSPSKTKKTFLQKANAFIAGPDWEFDGFVAGGQDQMVKSMFLLNDVIYLNLGFLNGVESGEKLSIYKRGGKIRDPQTGRFLGFEVRKAAVASVTDRVDEETCSVRITSMLEGVEIGDLVRRD